MISDAPSFKVCLQKVRPFKIYRPDLFVGKLKISPDEIWDFVCLLGYV